MKISGKKTYCEESEKQRHKDGARTKKARQGDLAGMVRSRRRPTLPHSFPCSTIGPEGLNFRVRDGNGCDPLGIATEKLLGAGGRGAGAGVLQSLVPDP